MPIQIFFHKCVKSVLDLYFFFLKLKKIVGKGVVQLVDNQASAGEEIVKKENFFFNHFRFLYSLF